MRTYTEQELKNVDWMFKWPGFVRLSKLAWGLCYFSMAILVFEVILCTTNAFGLASPAEYAWSLLLPILVLVILWKCFPSGKNGFDPSEICERNRLLAKANGKEYAALMEHMRGVIAYYYPKGYTFSGGEVYDRDVMQPCMARWMQCHRKAGLITPRPGY